MYRGTVSRITANFTTLRHGPNNGYETILANRAIVAGNFVVIKKISDKNAVIYTFIKFYYLLFLWLLEDDRLNM
jgi:hypothetical protein